VIYRVSDTVYTSDFAVACSVFSVLAVALAVYRVYNWKKTANKPQLDVVLIGKFVVVAAGLVGSTLFVILYLTSFFWTMLYKVSMS